MQKLISYTPNSDTSFALTGDLSLHGSELELEFSLVDPKELFEVPKMEAQWTANEALRKEGLWQGTCFEAFLQPSGGNRYYEFNFALNPAWNAYEFTGYREPQPPQATSDFVLKAMSWNPAKKHLQVRLQNNSGFRKFQVGLTAILLEKNGAKHFYALHHAGAKPDFHLHESFILQRGS